MPRKASTVASVCSRASAVSLGFKDRLGFTRSSSTRANSTYRHRKLPLRRRLSLIDPFYGHTVHFLIHIEVVRVVARPALRRRSVVRRLFSGTLHRCLRAFVALIVSRRRVCTYFSHTIRARPRLATLHPQDIGRRLRLQRAFAPFQVRLELDRIARLPCPFSLSTPLFRVKMANRSSVFARRARARPFVVPRPPVRVVVRARATHRFHHRSTFRPSLAPVSRARLSRAHRTARTRFRRRHGRRRLSLRRARHRAASAECGVRARGRSPPNPRVDGVFIFYRSRDRDRDRGFDAHTAAIDRDRGPRARARPDRPTADRRPPTRRGEARRRRGDAAATGRGATARRGRRRARARTSANERERARTSANERERARTRANERERTRTNARSVRRPTDDARARDGASHRIPSRLDYPKYSRWIRWSGRRARDRTVRCTNGGMRR